MHFSESKEASSGCYSVVALSPLSEEGRVFVQRAGKQFQRNLPLSLHPLATQFARTEIDWALDSTDWQLLNDFADFFLPLSFALPSIQRLMKSAGELPFPLLGVVDFPRVFANRLECLIDRVKRRVWVS